MPKVVIDGVEYVPKADVSTPSDEKLLQALQELVSIQYFREPHKAVAQAWNVLNFLSPDLARLSAQDSHAAYERMNGAGDD